MPEELALLGPTLEILDVGQTPVFALQEYATVIGQLTNLVELRHDEVNFISLTGIPTEIGNLKRLVAYGCASNLYSGALDGAAFPSDMTALGKWIFAYEVEILTSEQ